MMNKKIKLFKLALASLLVSIIFSCTKKSNKKNINLWQSTTLILAALTSSLGQNCSNICFSRTVQSCMNLNPLECETSLNCCQCSCEPLCTDSCLVSEEPCVSILDPDICRSVNGCIFEGIATNCCLRDLCILPLTTTTTTSTPETTTTTLSSTSTSSTTTPQSTTTSSTSTTTRKFTTTKKEKLPKCGI